MNCKGKICREKCEVCVEKNMDCCNVIPIFSEHELAKLIFESDYLQSSETSLF
jgi:hypothetical protein